MKYSEFMELGAFCCFLMLVMCISLEDLIICMDEITNHLIPIYLGRVK